MGAIKQFSYLRSVAIILMAVGFIGFSPQTPAQAGNGDPWTVAKVEGTASVSHDGAGWQPLRKGDVLQPGSRMKTGKDGRAVLKRPGDSVSVSPGTSFGIPSGQEKRPLGNIFQSLGTLLFKLETRPQDPFNVKTPYLAAVIRGTTFTVFVDDSNAALHVARGAVEVTSVLSGETVLVRPGQTAVVDPRAGGALKLVGRSNHKQQTRIKKSGKSAAATKSAAKTTGHTRILIPRQLGRHKIDIRRVTGGLVGDGAKAPNARHGNSGTFASRDSGKGIGIGNGSGNGGVSNGVGNGGLSNGTGNGGISNGIGAPVDAIPSIAADIAKARKKAKKN